jgi:hypothetical protein
VTPRTADAIRKVLAYGLATVLTVLLFRVLSRTANGRQTLGDLELWATVALAALGFLWVRAARRVRRAPAEPTERGA